MFCVELPKLLLACAAALCVICVRAAKRCRSFLIFWPSAARKNPSKVGAPHPLPPNDGMPLRLPEPRRLNGWPAIYGPIAASVAGDDRQTDVIGMLLAAGSLGWRRVWGSSPIRLCH